MIVRRFLAAETAVFVTAALIHAGVIFPGYEHARARNAEMVIALVLLAGLSWSAITPTRVRAAGLAAQGFALLGTIVGLFTIAIGVGPRSVLDLTMHAAMATLLVGGLMIAR